MTFIWLSGLTPAQRRARVEPFPPLEAVRAPAPAAPVESSTDAPLARLRARRAYQPGPGPIHAEEIMTLPVVTIAPDATQEEARVQMDRRRVRHLPVVAGDLLVGILSDRDLQQGDVGVVRDRMTQPVLTALVNTEIRELARKMVQDRIGCLPVVNGSYALVGIVTRSDILRWLARYASLDQVA